ncbi:unnamed protein product [Musa banksii]
MLSVETFGGGEAAAVGGKGCRSVGWMKGMAARLSVASIVLVICTLLLFSAIGVTRPSNLDFRIPGILEGFFDYQLLC